MRVLMISIDKTLLGAGQGGDALSRHIEYSSKVESLDIIVFSGKKQEPNAVTPNFTVHSTNSSSRIRYFLDAYSLGKKIYEQRQYNVIDLQDPFIIGFEGYLLKRRFHVPMIVHFHGDFWDNYYWNRASYVNSYKFLNPLIFILSKFIVKKSDGIRVVSQGIKDKLVNYGIDGGKIRVISTPVDVDAFTESNLNEVQGIKRRFNNKNIVLFVGGLAEIKNIPLLIRAAPRVLEKAPKTHFVIIGKGPLKESMIMFARKLGVERNFSFLGEIPHHRLPDYYHASDVVVFPSWSESFGKIIVEAGAAGKAVVATATTGAKSIIKDGETGFLVPINDEHMLSEKIAGILRSDALKGKLGAQAKEFIIRKFNREKNISEIVKFWESVVKNNVDKQ